MNLSMKNEAEHQNVNTTDISVIPEISVAFEAHESHYCIKEMYIFLREDNPSVCSNASLPFVVFNASNANKVCMH